MTTTRVTVPVEDWKHVIGALKNAQARLGPGAAVCNVSAALAKVERLSAAPAPEGGAVEDLREALIQADLKIMSLPGTDQSDVEFIREALATREEAPAEEGEDDGLFLLMKRGLYYRPNAMGYTGIKDHAGRYTKAEAESHADPVSGVTAVAASDAPDFSPACFDDLARAHLDKKLAQVTRELSALRAQPQAREDAQPVASAYRVRPEMNDPEEWTLMHPERAFDYLDRPGWETQPLYTHPAPDALRVAAEALTRTRRLVAEASESGFSDPDTVRALFVNNGAITQALAALQAEQKGGA